MVSRVVKTLIRDELNKTPIYETSALISNVFNCLFAIESGFKVPATSFTPQELKERIIVDVKKRFRFDLDSGFLNTIRFSLIRSICLKVGIQIQARTYDLSGLVFKNEDIVNMYPIIKHAQPRAAFASEAYEHGRASISQDQKELGMELIRESVSMYEQIYGPIHCETGRAYANLGMLHYNDQQFKQALAMQRRAVIVCERTIGVDDPETLRQYVFAC
jgi:protein TIF31